MESWERTLSIILNIMLCLLADGIDGKQARRINLSGPLGELFDHGLGEYLQKIDEMQKACI